MTVDGKPTFILMNESSREYFEVDAATNAVWNLADGKKTVKEIFVLAKETDNTLTERDVRDVIISLAEEGTIESTEPELEQKRVDLVSTFQLDINLVRDSSTSLAWFFKITRSVIKKQELSIAIGISILGVAFFSGAFVQILANPSVFRVAGSTLLGFLFYQMVVLLPVYVIHELAHAAACDYYGGKPRELGTGFYYLAPFFYCDTSDSWRLGRRARIMISLAGPLSTVVVASFFVFGSYFVPPGFARNVLQIGAFFGFYGTLVNFSPVIETDGYYVLADILKIPNLRDESFSYIKRVFLRKLGRPLSVAGNTARHRRIFLLYAVIGVTWFVFWGYSTSRLMYIYGLDAYSAFLSLQSTVLRMQPFSAATVGLNLVTLSYFTLLVLGFGVIGTTAYRNLRFRGVKLETIHDKRVSVFLPLPSFFPRQHADRLVEATRKLSRKFSHSFSVTWEPPLCVASLKLGKVDESLDDMRRQMLSLERSFKSLHYTFLSKNLDSSSEEASNKKLMADNLNKLATQFPQFERKEAVEEVSQFLRRRDELIKYLLHSAFGTVWTLELSPDDYRRIRGEIFPSLIAQDLGVTDLYGELEHFKKHTVLGLDSVAQLSSEIEQESGKVHKKPEIYQVTAFIEPIRSRLVFVGRTERVERSIAWLGGLFLYQAWTGYISEVLDEASLGLKSIRLAPSHSFTKTHIMKLPDGEFRVLKQDFDWIGTLKETLDEAIARIGGTYESATNFQETLNSLVTDETFDVGLYRPILRTNEKRLVSARIKIEKFHGEYNRMIKELDRIVSEVGKEYLSRASKPGLSNQRVLRNSALRVLSFFHLRSSAGRGTPAYDAGVKLLFATARLVYDVVIASDIVM